jgi:uncharacterized protein (TIGR00369 family)
MSTQTPTINVEYVRRLKKLVLDASYPRLIGMHLEAIDIDRATLVLDIDDQRHFQPFGIVHGGVLATLIDTATFWAAYMRLPPDTGLVNIDLKLNYLQPAAGGRLTAKGRCIRPGRTLSYTEAHIYDGRGELLVHGTSTLMALPGRGIDLGVSKFETRS